MLNAFIDKIYKHKNTEIEDLSLKDVKNVNKAAFELLE